MKINIIFPIKASNSAHKLLHFLETVICTNLIACSAKLCLHAAERGQLFAILELQLCLQFCSIVYLTI